MDDTDDLFDIEDDPVQEVEKKEKFSVFKNSFVLDPRYTPQKLIARDEQIKSLAALFRPILKGSTPHHAMICGLPGTGKSVVLRYVTDRLNRALIKKRVGASVNLITVSCNDSSITRILQNILSKLSPDARPKPGLPVSTYIGDIFDIMNKTKESLILVLDEFDEIPRTDILYPLVRAYEQETIDPGVYLSVVGVLNDIAFYDTLDARVVSSMRAQTIIFEPYSAPELLEVLEGRRHAFKQGVLDDEVIPYCAAISARERGDAREAIDLLRKAGELADIESNPIVTLDYVKKAKFLLDVAPNRDTINALPQLHKHILCAYLLLEEEGVSEVRTGNLHARYATMLINHNERPVGIGRFSSTLSGMEMAGVITATKQSLGRKGLSRKIVLGPTIQGIRTVLMQDPQFRPLLELAGGI